MKLSKYKLVQTLDDVAALDDFLMEDDKPKFERIAVDTETNGLAFWKDVVIGISLSTDSASGFYIPLLTWAPDTSKPKKKKGETSYPEGQFQCVWSGKLYPENVTQADYQAPDWLAPMLKRWFRSVQLIMHNAPFDCLMIENNFGVDLSQQVFCDTLLLKHVLDETTSCGLKETALLWQAELGFGADEAANQEQKELGASVVKNGGTFNKATKHVWRADLDVMAKYAVADTFLTFGVFEVGIEKFFSEYDEKHWQWFFEDEVMPLCREVVIPMKRRGVTINVPHFVEMEQETRLKLQELEAQINQTLSERGLLAGFSKGKSVDKTVTKKRLVEKIIELEGLAYPTTKAKGVLKRSLSKAAVTAAYNQEPHWLWGYLLGEDELRYSKERLGEIKQELYKEIVGRQYHFNIRSGQHLRWLFCDKLKHDATKLPQTDSATKTNPIPKMDADVLEEHFLAKYDFVKPILLFKKLDKLYGTYILPAITLNYDGVLYMDMMQHGTVSGRFACGGGFNLQTLPKVEDVSRCKKCGAKDVTVVNPIKLLAVMYCNECNHLEEDVLCPSAIKQGFVPPKGMKIVNADYSSLEPRCFAFMSGDSGLKKVYQDGLDLYSKIYCDMEDKEGRYSPHPKAENFLKKQRNDLRDMVKPVVLGVPYGARGPQTANLMGFKKTIVDWKGNRKEVLDVERGWEFRDKYLDTYPRLKDYMLTQEAKTNGPGYVETIVGRRRHFKFGPKVFKLLVDSGIDYEEFLDEKRQNLTATSYKGLLNKEGLKALADACGFQLFDAKKGVYRDWAFVRSMYSNELNNSKNFPIQGLGAHITNRAMLEMTREFRRLGLRSWVCLQVHDEITSYSADEHVEQTVEVVRRCMEKNLYTALLDIPMTAEPLVAVNLKEAK
jgi:DNA polymerase I-like protein with 3'-5' exonuclease and polymerase domains